MRGYLWFGARAGASNFCAAELVVPKKMKLAKIAGRGQVRQFCIGLVLFALVFAAGEPVAKASGQKDDQSRAAGPSGPPPTEIRPVNENFHGTRFIDKYRWLEDGTSPETQKWVAAETQYTRATLDPLPGREAIHKRLTELLSTGDIGTPKMAGRFYFYTRREGMQNQPVLYVREDADGGKEGKERALVDVNRLAADGTVALDWFFPSENGRYVAYGTSDNGSEMSTLHVIETKSGELLPDAIDRTQYVSIAWQHDNAGFYYTRYPQKGDVPAGQERYNKHVFYHELGADPETDLPIFGEGRDPEDRPEVSLDNDGRLLLITVWQGWTKTELFLMDLKARKLPTRITTGKNFIYRATVYNGRLYILTDEDAPRYRMFAAEAGDYERENWKEIIPQTEAVLRDVHLWGGKILAQYEQNATSQLRIFDIQGHNAHDIALPGIGSVTQASGKWNHDEAFYRFESFTSPPAVYRYDLQSGVSSIWARVSAPSIDQSAYEVKQEWCKSKDGTSVPMFIVSRKGLKEDGHNPALLTGDGGFGISVTPHFDADTYLWLERGGIYVVANLRGGGEFGEDWHRAGMMDKKLNVFDDMIAAAEHLISEKYTDANHLAIEGEANGGLLMGAMITQHPELFRAVVFRAPVLDMLHYQEFQIARLWIPEYGDPENTEQFKWLYAYSPYHHVKAGVEYPAVLFLSGDSDTQVDAVHARKMAALLQASLLQASAVKGASRERPVLLRVETKAGDTTEMPIGKRIEELTDLWSFLFWQTLFWQTGVN
jgi:prolyl oligopeptidase